MNNEEMKIDANPNSEEIELIRKRLDEFNEQIAGNDNHKPINLIIKNSVNEIIAGLIGGTYWGWLYIDRVWIKKENRNMGLGSKLLKAAEAEAKGRGCGFAHLDTMSFQAKGFYEKNGYSVKYEIKDIPKGFSKYLMIKELK